MTREDSVKWLETLKKAIGQSQYQGLWHYEQALAKTIELLQSDRLVELPCKVGRFVYADTRLFCKDCLKEEVRKLDYICCNVVNVRYDKNMKALIYLRPIYRRDFNSRYHIFVSDNAIGTTVPKYGGGRHKSVVYFRKGKFAVDGSNYGFKDICPKNMEVIGNIYDNPELLELEK